MSYILDALRRAEAERERGAVPGLHSQSSTVPPSGGSPGRSAVPAGVWLAGGLSLGLVLAAIAWWWMGGRAGAATGTAPVPTQAMTAVSAGDTAVASAPMPTTLPPAGPALASRPADPVVAAVAVQDAEVPSPVPPAPRRTPPVGVAATTPETTASAPGSSRLRLDLAGAASAGAERPAPAEASVDGGVKRLSAAERQRLPKLTLGGSMYSEDRASRMLVINDQVVREGERAAPGVTLERIGPHAAELSFEGKRFELPY